MTTMKNLLIPLVAVAGLALAPAALAEPNQTLEAFVTKVVCQRLAEGNSPAAMARQLVADRMVANEQDGRVMIRRAAAAGCPEFSWKL